MFLYHVPLPVIELAKGMRLDTFEQLYKDKSLQSLVSEYKRAISTSDIKWQYIHIVFNAILNKADELAGERQHEEQIMYKNPNIRYALIDTIYEYGLSPVREVQGGGCPTNKGFSIFTDIQSLFTPLTFSSLVNQSETNQTTWEYHTGACVVCKKDPTEVGPCNICKVCEKKF
jgi:hypothetical protein